MYPKLVLRAGVSALPRALCAELKIHSRIKGYELFSMHHPSILIESLLCPRH
jgi:hypothetical protein